MVPVLTLNNGVEMPQLGLGTARVGDEEIRRTVAQSLDIGYALIDTAAKYENEAGVGRGIVDAGVPREDVFVTTKLRGSDQGFESAKQALDASFAASAWTTSTCTSFTGRCRGSTGTSSRGVRWRSCSRPAGHVPSASPTSFPRISTGSPPTPPRCLR